MKIIIPGQPIAKKRPRFSKHGHAYNDQKKEELTTQLIIKPQIMQSVLNGPVIVEMRFYMKRPILHYGTGRNADILKMVKSEADHIVTPDLDNMVKFYLDCLNKMAWEDDCQVINIVADKRYTNSRNPRTEIEIWEA